jgi:hypothetical protein
MEQIKSSEAPILNSTEFQQQSFNLKSQSCHQLEKLMDFPLIDDDEVELAPTPPIRPARRNAKSPKRGDLPVEETTDNITNGETTTPEKIVEKIEEPSPKQTPVKKTVSLPATPLTDPEKFGIPVRNTTKHYHNKNQAPSSKKKLTLNTSKSKSSEDNSLASPVDQVPIL